LIASSEWWFFSFSVSCWLRRRSQTAETYRQEAIEASRRKSWDQAIACYRKALELAQNDALSIFNHAQFLNPGGNISDSNFGNVTKSCDPHIGQVSAKFWW
jgi:hypothetical protein